MTVVIFRYPQRSGDDNANAKKVAVSVLAEDWLFATLKGGSPPWPLIKRRCSSPERAILLHDLAVKSQRLAAASVKRSKSK